MADFDKGRVKQKRRTHEALVAIAVERLKKGKVLSVAEVADLAQVGRTTAYRYFPTQEHLLAHAMMTIHVENVGENQFDAFFRRCTDVALKVRRVVTASDESIRKHESEYRTILRMSLESDQSMPHRTKVRTTWIRKALAELRQALGKKRFERLAAALGLCVGIEPTVVLRDVYGLSPDAAREVKLWAAEAILSHALKEIKGN